MPIDYKPLGVKRPTAAKPTQIINMIKNGSFEGRSLEGWKLNNDSSTRAFPYFFDNAGLQDLTVSDPSIYAKTFSSNVCARITADASRPFCIWQAYDPLQWGVPAQEMFPADDVLTPALPYKQYYFAFSMMLVQNSGSTFRLQVQEWDSDKRFIQSQNLDYSGSGWKGDPRYNGWERVWSTFYSSGQTSYFSFAFLKTAADNVYHYFDDLYVGESLEFARAPLNPDTFVDQTFLAPFDKRRFGYLGEQHNSYVGQSYAGPLENAYTVPAGKNALISSIVVNNVGKVRDRFRIAYLPAGAPLSSLTSTNFLYFDKTIDARENLTLANGITLGAGDQLYVAADSGDVTFQLFGSEMS